MLILVNVEDDNLSILDTDDNIIEIITSDDYINRYNSLHIAGLFIKDTGELWKVPLDVTKFNFHSKVSKDYFGKVLKMNCGLYCMIIGYRSNTDVDFMFETGLSLLNCSRLRKFNDYTLAPLIKDIRIGEENIMNNGAKAKILSYRNHRDFEDSTIRTTTYENFLNGCVLNRHINECSFALMRTLSYVKDWFFTDYKLIEFNKRVSISKGLGISLVRNSLKEIFQLLCLDSFTIYLNDSVINLCKEEVL